MVELSIMLLKLIQYLIIKQHSTNILINKNYEKLLIIKLTRLNQHYPPLVLNLKTWTESYNAYIKNKTERKLRQ